MATMNPFDLLGDDDSEDPSLLVAAQQKIELKKPSGQGLAKPTGKPAAQAKLPGKPLPPAQAVREAKSESGRGGGGGGRGYGRGRGVSRGSYRDSSSNENPYGNRDTSAAQGTPGEVNSGKPSERRSGYGGPRGGRRGGFSNGEAGEGEHDRPRRYFDRRSGTGRGNEMKREGAGRGNWGTESDDQAPVPSEVAEEGEKPVNEEKPSGEDNAAPGDKEAEKTEVEGKEPENKEMTLEEYEKLLEEKRKTLLAIKTTETRKVDTKEFESMQALANKKANDDVFIKLGSEKDKKKELAEKEERAKKSVSINEFLKPADGEQFYNRGGRGGRGRGGSRGGGYYRSGGENVSAPAIEDPSQFPSLGGK